MNIKQKLELDWIGKDDLLHLEPRILLEDEKLSIGSEKENLLIRGDNLLALKALESDYKGKIKCIFISNTYKIKFI